MTPRALALIAAGAVLVAVTWLYLIPVLRVNPWLGAFLNAAGFVMVLFGVFSRRGWRS